MSSPYWPGAVQDVVTSAAILIGGGWALWKWGFEERLRRHREMPAVDGTLTFDFVPLPDDRAWLTLQALWCNRGTMPISLCSEHSNVQEYELTGSPPDGHIALKAAPGLTMVGTVPFRFYGYVLEPKTDSPINEHFIVSRTSVYGFRWVICLGPPKHLKCSRELICQAVRNG